MKRTINFPRKGIQWTILGLIFLFALWAKVSNNFSADLEAYCPFGGLQALGSFLLNDALSCTMTGVQITMGITLMVTVILLSKLFCSFICPIGTVSEWMSKQGQKWKIQLSLPDFVDKGLRSLKYILLFTTLYFTFQSNELFCKKFDPYYGITSGFDSDVVLLYSIAAILVVIVGSMLIRLFWCKYLCPLGAISNIFKFTGFFAIVILIYLLLLKLGVNISFVWPLVTACLGGYLIEITQLHGKVFPLVKVSRNLNSCTNCSLCSKHCHQGIDVAKLKAVKDADCNLCGDCVSICPEKETLQFNKTKKLGYFPHIATLVFILIGLFLGQYWELPTINQKWADFEDYENVKTYSRTGLSSIKCYGSSSSFANKMRQIDGVLGVTTYVNTKTANVYYDASKINDEIIDRAIFTPQKLKIRTLENQEKGVIKVHLTLENFFDKNDFSHLSRFLYAKTTAVGLNSEFGCPVKIDIYFPDSERLNKDTLIDILETKSFEYTYNEQEYTANMGYKVMSSLVFSELDTKAYTKAMFVPVDYQFNYRDQYSDEATALFKTKSPLNNSNRSKVKYLVSHLSNDNGIVEFHTQLNGENTEEMIITYIDTLTSLDNINRLLTSDSLQFSYRDGRVQKTPNIFNFKYNNNQSYHKYDWNVNK